MRAQATRANFIPENALKITSKTTSAIAYFHDYKGKPAMVAFAGKRQKPDVYAYFANEDARAKKAEAFFQSVEAQEQRQQAARTVHPVAFAVGDILSASWGYECSRVDFFKVLSIRGRRIELAELSQVQTYGDDLRGSNRWAVAGDKIEKIITKTVSRDGRAVKINDFMTAFPWDGRKVLVNDY